MFFSLFLFSSQEKSEKVTGPVADRVETVQVEAVAVLATHSGPSIVQKSVGLPGAGCTRSHWVLQVVQARPAAQLRYVRP